jgi:hypothetical protein
LLWGGKYRSSLSLSLSLCAVDGSENRPANWGRWLCALVQWEAFANFFSSSIALAVIGSPHFGPHTYTPPPPLKYKGIRNEVKTEINSPNTHTHTQQSLGGYVPCACSTFLSIPPPFFQLYPFGKKKTHFKLNSCRNIYYIIVIIISPEGNLISPFLSQMIRRKGTTLSPQRKKHKNGYVIRQKNIRRPKHRNSFFFLCLIEILHGKKMRLAGVYAQAPLSLSVVT